MRVALILGTIRIGSNSAKVAKAVIKFATKNYPEFNISLIDPADNSLGFNGYDRHTPSKYKDAMASAQAFIIVSPEYNHSFPSFLKLMLDSAYDEYNYKPVFIVGVSDGRYGGTRMIEHLIPVLKSFKMHTLNTDVPIPMVQNVIENEEIKDEITLKLLTKAFEELSKFVKA